MEIAGTAPARTRERGTVLAAFSCPLNLRPPLVVLRPLWQRTLAIGPLSCLPSPPLPLSTTSEVACLALAGQANFLSGGEAASTLSKHFFMLHLRLHQSTAEWHALCEQDSHPRKPIYTTLPLVEISGALLLFPTNPPSISSSTPLPPSSPSTASLLIFATVDKIAQPIDSRPPPTRIRLVI